MTLNWEEQPAPLRVERPCRDISANQRGEVLWGAGEGSLFSLEKRSDLIVNFSILMRGSRGVGTNLCSCDQWQDPRKWLKLSQGTFRLDIRKRVFTQSRVGLWNRLPWEVSTASSLPGFEAFGQHSQAQDGILGVSRTAGLILMGPFQLSIFYDSTK